MGKKVASKAHHLELRKEEFVAALKAANESVHAWTPSMAPRAGKSAMKKADGLIKENK